MGICDSTGRVHDFAGPYYVSQDQFMVGEVKKYLLLDPVTLQPAADSKNGDAALDNLASGQDASSAASHWDQSIAAADKEYGKRMHNICCDNCHHQYGHASMCMYLCMYVLSALHVCRYVGM